MGPPHTTSNQRDRSEGASPDGPHSATSLEHGIPWGRVTWAPVGRLAGGAHRPSRGVVQAVLHSTPETHKIDLASSALADVRSSQRSHSRRTAMAAASRRSAVPEHTNTRLPPNGLTAPPLRNPIKDRVVSGWLTWRATGAALATRRPARTRRPPAAPGRRPGVRRPTAD